MDTVNLFRPITKLSVEIDSPDSVPEVIANAFRTAESPRAGATFISAPDDLMNAGACADILTPAGLESLGPSDPKDIAAAAELINKSNHPVLLLGLQASAVQPDRSLTNQTGDIADRSVSGGRTRTVGGVCRSRAD
jgi:acetolactate synthase-1/2/3 large subunit